LTGEQGVIIPSANIQNLMLRKDVIDAVKKKQFHVYRVSTVAEGVEALTGVPAGQADEDGRFPPGTVFGAVQQQLKSFFERAYRMKKELDLNS
jgi:predicted ATP-dependent protease